MKNNKKIYWAIESGIFPHVERDLIKLLEDNVVVFEEELNKDFGDDQVFILGSPTVVDKLGHL